MGLSNISTKKKQLFNLQMDLLLAFNSIYIIRSYTFKIGYYQFEIPKIKFYGR